MTDFQKTTWVNDASPDITAEQLNRIEEGIDTAHVEIEEAKASASAASATATAAQTSVGSHTARTDNPHGTTAKQVGARHQKNAVKLGAKGDDATDNTAILQAALDEIRNSGKPGVLYLPGDEGTVFRTKGLWVPSNCKIIGDGATLKGIGSQQAAADARATTGEWPDPNVWARGLLTICPQTHNVAITDTDVNDVLIEGLRLIPYQGPWSRDPNDDKSQTAGILVIQAKGVTVRDVVIESGAGTESVDILTRLQSRYPSEDLLFENVKMLGGRRNTIAATDIKRLTLRGCTITGALSDATSADGAGQEPGFGIDFEPNAVTDLYEDIRILDCLIYGNAACGIGINYDTTPASSTRWLIRGCTIRDNGVDAALVGGVTNYGGILFKGGVPATAGPVLVEGNVIAGNLRGDSIDGSGTNGHSVIVVGNDLRPASGFVALGIAPAIDSGNLKT